jgi:GDP-4-dehydro-6-deoxy-D-mannose reductase
VVAAWARPDTRPPFEPDASAAMWRDVELLDPRAVREALAELRPAAIYHCAGAAHVAESWEATAITLEINVLGTHHVLEADRRLGLGARILVPGSATVYQASSAPLTESSALGPGSPYGVSKLAQEQLAVHAARDGQHVLVTRSFNHIGPRQAPSFAAASFARQIARIEAGLEPAALEVGNLDARRDLTDVRDTVRAYLALVQHGRPGRVYNVASGEARSMDEVLDALRRRATCAVTVEIDPARYRPNDAPLVIGDATRLREETGWHPVISFDQTIDDLLAFWREVARQEPAVPPAR